MKALSKFALLVVLTALLYLLISGNLLSWSPFVIAAQVLAVGLSAWTRRSFHTSQFSIRAEPEAGQLLRKGPFKLIRHPMYAAMLLLIWSGVLGHLSLINLVVGVIVAGVIASRVVVEEQYLLAKYPDYAEYSTTTKRIIPYLI